MCEGRIFRPPSVSRENFDLRLSVLIFHLLCMNFIESLLKFGGGQHEITQKKLGGSGTKLWITLSARPGHRPVVQFHRRRSSRLLPRAMLQALGAWLQQQRRRESQLRLRIGQVTIECKKERERRRSSLKRSSAHWHQTRWRKSLVGRTFS